MKLTFTKGPGKTDWLDLLRADGSTLPRIDCPKQRIIPHDMVHFAVESVLAARGFLGMVASGIPATFTLGGVSEEAVERLVETIQAEAWSGPADTVELISLYELTCEARGHPAIPVDAAAIVAIRARMTDLTCRWDGVPVGGTMALDFSAPTS